MNRVYIDLTDLELWQGVHGGTQRVVYNISKCLQSNLTSKRVSYISFSAKEKIFNNSNFSFQSSNEDTKEKDASNPNVSTGLATLKTIVPNSFRSNKKLRSKIKKFIPVLINQNELPVVENRQVTFKKDDIILVLGKPWDNPDIQSHLSLLKTKGIKIFQVVYDLVPCLQPQLQNPAIIESYTNNLISAVKNSDMLFTISQSTQNDLEVFAKQNKLTLPKSRIIRLADASINSKKPIRTNNQNTNIDEKFILFVSTIEIRKNHTLLYYVYKLAAQNNLNLPRLILVGNQGWLTEEIVHMITNDAEINRKITILNNINDQELEWLYKKCLFTIFPSMYEGWGLPVAESLSRGKFCLSSNTSSMPEIAGDLIDYFSPYNTKECLDKIVEYTNTELLMSRERAIKTKYVTTDWEDTCHQIASFLKNP